MRFIVLLVCAAAVAAQVEIPNATPAEIEELFATKAGATRFVDCIINRRTCNSKKAGSAAIDNRLLSMSRIAPQIMRVGGDCAKLPKRIKCDPADAENIKHVIKIMQSKYPRQYRRLITHSQQK